MNRQFSEMFSAAAARLEGVDLHLAGERAGMAWDGRGLVFDSLGQAVRLDGASLRAEPELDPWHHLVILQFLEAADGRAPCGAWCALSDIPGGGVSRGASFDGEIEGLIASGLSGCERLRLERACAALGGAILPERGCDVCAAFSFLPRYPLLLRLWLADDEFPASGKVLVDGGVRHLLGVEAAGTVAALLVRELVRRI